MKEVRDKEGRTIGYDLKLSPEAFGAEVREHLVQLQNIYGLFSAELDDVAYELNVIKLDLEEAEALVNDYIEDYISKMPLQRKNIKKPNKLNIEVNLRDGRKTTVLKIKSDLIDIKKLHDNCDSKLKELDRAINTSRSLLAWDRMEYGNS